MDDQHNPDAGCVAVARALIAKAAKGVEQIEDIAGTAFCRLAALAGMLARLEKPAGSRDPDAVDAAEIDAVTLCREANDLLRYLDSYIWTSVRVAPIGRSRARPRAQLGGARARRA
jgi:hypothetical protein